MVVLRSRRALPGAREWRCRSANGSGAREDLDRRSLIAATVQAVVDRAGLALTRDKILAIRSDEGHATATLPTSTMHSRRLIRRRGRAARAGFVGRAPSRS